MNTCPLVSIVVPTFNRQEILDRCLRALAQQTYQRLEVIVVDDASTDGTPDLLARVAGDHPKLELRWFRNDRQLGANPSRNRAIEAASGAFIAFIDDDCIASPDWLERLMTGFVSDRVAAVTGLVLNAKPVNLYELTLKGTHRVHGRVHATRLVGGNMCLRRGILSEYGFHEDLAQPDAGSTVSDRGDEEGLFLMIRAAGHEQRVVHDAVVVHHHRHSRRSFWSLAYKGGQAAARLGYKYYLPPRIELAPLLMAYLTLPAVGINPLVWVLSGCCALFFTAAIVYNDLFRKRKTALEVLMTFPLLLVYYHVRLAGYLIHFVRLRIGLEKLERIQLHKRRITNEEIHSA